MKKVNAFLAFVRKETYHIIRDPRTLVILFAMPVALVIIFGYTVTNEFKHASIAIVDQSKDDLSRDLVHHFTASGHFQLIESVDDVSSLESAFKSGEIKMGIVIPPFFERDFYKDKETSIQLIADASDPNYAATLTNYAGQMIRTFQNNRSGENAQPYQIHIESRMLYNPKLLGSYYFIPGVVALILMLISAMMTSLTIAREKETGTMDLLLVSPLPPLLIIIGKITPYAVLSFIDAVVVFAMGYYLFEVPILGSLPMLLGLCLLYLMVALALGVLISAKAKTQQEAMMSSLFSLLLPTMLLSGFIFPIASMPALLQYISKIIPAKYFIIIEKSIMLKGGGWDTVAFPAMILTIMMLVLFIGAFRNFKVRYK
jgi:ABC-2 type transport system permease protein